MDMINLSAKSVFQLLNFEVLLVFNKLIERGGTRDRSLIMVGRAGGRK